MTDPPRACRAKTKSQAKGKGKEDEKDNEGAALAHSRILNADVRPHAFTLSSRSMP